MDALCRAVVGWDLAKWSPWQPIRNTGSAQAQGQGRCHHCVGQTLAVLDFQQGKWEYQGVLMISLPSAACPVSVLPEPTVFPPLFKGCFVDHVLQ